MRTVYTSIVGKAKGLVNSTVVNGVDAETWSIIAAAAALGGVPLLLGKSVKKTYAPSMRELMLYRSVTYGSTVTASFVTTAAFDVLGCFLGNNWSVSVYRSVVQTRWEWKRASASGIRSRYS